MNLQFHYFAKVQIQLLQKKGGRREVKTRRELGFTSGESVDEGKIPHIRRILERERTSQRGEEENGEFFLGHRQRRDFDRGLGVWGSGKLGF